MNKKHIISALAMAFFAFLALGSSEDDRTPEQKAQDSCEDEFGAQVIAEKFVKDRLKSPSTADFPGYIGNGVQHSYLGECTHLIAGKVDSQNGFGAMIRSTYVAKVRYNKSEDTYNLLDIAIQ